MAFSLNLEKINLNKTAALKAKDTKINVNLEKNPNYSNYEEIDYNQGNIEITKEESSLLTNISNNNNLWRRRWTCIFCNRNE